MELIEHQGIVILETIEEWDKLIKDFDKVYGDQKTIELIGCPGGSKLVMRQDGRIFSVCLGIGEKGEFKFSLSGSYKTTLQNNTKEQQELYQLIRLGLM